MRAVSFGITLLAILTALGCKPEASGGSNTPVGAPPATAPASLPTPPPPETQATTPRLVAWAGGIPHIRSAAPSAWVAAPLTMSGGEALAVVPCQTIGADVSTLFAADPRMTSQVRRIHRLTWDERAGRWHDTGVVFAVPASWTDVIALEGGGWLARGSSSDFEGTSTPAMWVSTDDGRTWGGMAQGTPIHEALSPFPANLSHDVLHRGPVVLARADPNAVDVNDADLYANLAVAGDIVAAVFGNSGPALRNAVCSAWRTRDGGQTWTRIPGPPVEGSVAVYVNGMWQAGTQALSVLSAYGNQSAWMSFDLGQTWTEYSAATPGQYAGPFQVVGATRWAVYAPARRP